MESNHCALWAPADLKSAPDTSRAQLRRKRLLRGMSRIERKCTEIHNIHLHTVNIHTVIHTHSHTLTKHHSHTHTHAHTPTHTDRHTTHSVIFDPHDLHTHTIFTLSARETKEATDDPSSLLLSCLSLFLSLFPRSLGWVTYGMICKS